MVKIAHASISENGSVNGVAGDQNSREVCVRDWYNKPWTCVIRFKDPVMRERFASDMESAALNNHIGYGQKNRNDVLIEGKKVGYDLSKISKDINCDCSSLVSVACMYAGIFEGTLYSYGNCATTRTLRKALESTGEVEVFVSDDYTKHSDKLIRGDILLAEGSHVAGVIQADNCDGVKPVDVDIVKKVLEGKLGNAEYRKEQLKKLGYSAEAVQRKVNEILTYAESAYHMKKNLGEYWEIMLAQLK